MKWPYLKLIAQAAFVGLVFNHTLAQESDHRSVGSKTEGAPVVARVMTWNLEWFPGGSPTATKEQADEQFATVQAAVIAAKPDVLILQEVRDEDSVKRLVEPLHLTVHVVSRFRDQVGGVIGLQQIAICSRFPAEVVFSEAWKNGWANAPRGFAFARIKIGDFSVRFYGLHLKSNLGNGSTNTSKREDATEQLLKHESGQEGDASVIAGDFNTSFERDATFHEKTMGLMKSGGLFWSFEGIPFEERVTVRAKGSYPNACFDHIMTRGLGKPTGKVLNEAKGSDHLPVIVDIDFSKP